MYTSDAGIQKTQIKKGAVADKGIPEKEIRTIKCSFGEGERERFTSWLLTLVDPEKGISLEEKLQQIAGVAQVDDVTNCAQADEDSKRNALYEGMKRNLADFDLMSGSGFTSNLLDALKSDERFEGCFPEGGDAPASAPKTTVDLDF